MNKKITYLLLITLLWGSLAVLSAQETPNPNWDRQKIKGVRYMPYPSYNGFPFLNDGWVPGKIVFADGEISDSLFLRYSAYKDELLYYNQQIPSHVVIDKASLKGFSFVGKNGVTRTFRKQFFDGFLKGDRFFEILSKGETDLIVFRKNILSSTQPYKGEGGILMDQNYVTAYQYYFYNPAKGYSLVRLNKKAFLDKFAPKDQKAIKKLIRKNRIRINDEESLILGWKTIEREGYQVLF